MRKMSGNSRSLWFVFAACFCIAACAGAFMKPSGDTLVESARAYWEARSNGIWAKAYSFELHQGEESLDVYSARMAESTKRLPFELVSVSHPEVEETAGRGKVEVTLKFEVKYPTRTSMKQKVKDPWEFKDGRWYHDARPHGGS